MPLIIRIILLVSLLISSTFVYAEKDDKPLSMSVFTRLNSIEKLMNQQDFDKAQRKLSKMMNKLPDEPTDRAYILYTQATLYLYKEKYAQAQKHYKSSYELNALNQKTTSSVAQILGNLALYFEQYEQAVKFLTDHIQLSEGGVEKAILLSLGTAHYQLKDYASVEAPMKEIIERFKPDKNAYLLLFSSYYEQKKINSATDVLEMIVRSWPEEPEYWLQLASIYLEQKKVSRSLEVLQLAFSQKLLIKENELLQYVYALYEKGLPNKAAEILAQAIKYSLVKKNYKNYSLLAALYVDARQDNSALKAFELAAGFAKDGKDDLYIAQIYYDRESWKESIAHAKKALNMGVKSPGNAHMMIAASYHEMEQTMQTRKHLLQANKHKETRKNATQWLSSLE